MRVMNDKDFSPIDITIRLESRAEANRFYSIFNYVPITDYAFPSCGGSDIRDYLNDCGISNGVDELEELLINKIREKI